LQIRFHDIARPFGLEAQHQAELKMSCGVHRLVQTASVLLNVDQATRFACYLVFVFFSFYSNPHSDQTRNRPRSGDNKMISLIVSRSGYMGHLVTNELFFVVKLY
jgi:hypothetical protein